MRVTRRANDDDTLISRGGRGSFFKGQPGRERERASERRRRSENRGVKQEDHEGEKEEEEEEEEEEVLSSEANVRNDS